MSRSHQTRYEFPTPFARKMVPLFFIAVAWSMPAILAVLPKVPWPEKVLPYAHTFLLALEQYGVTYDNAFKAASVATVPLLLWFLMCFDRLVITDDSIYLKSPFRVGRPLHWADASDILIDHVGRRFEGPETAKHTLTVRGRPSLLHPWGRVFRISNYDFDGYHHAERIAVENGIPAIASARFAAVDATGRPSVFPEFTFTERLWGVLFACAALGALWLWAADPEWMRPHVYARPLCLAGAVLCLAFAARRFFYRALAVDRGNLYIMRRNWAVRTVPVDSVTECETHGNGLEITAVDPRKPGSERVVFRTGRFLRGRAVLLCMIRQQRTVRAHDDRTPISIIRTTRTFEPRYAPATPPQSAKPLVDPGESAPDPVESAK